jgi:hypothetical protein
MNAVVLVPFRSDPVQPRRDAIWDHVRARWDGWRLVVGDNDGPEFDRASSINRAAAEAGDWDVAIVSDADCLLDPMHLAEEACQVALAEFAYVVPHNRLVDVTRRGTDAILRGRDPERARHKETIALTWGGMFAIPRGMWDMLGGFDRRFWGYGGEDLALIFACGTIGQQLRLDGALYHLWHGWVPGRKELPGYERNMGIVQEYRAHMGNPRSMRKFLETRR